VERAQTAAALGQAAAINRKDAVRAVPQLGKLIKDNDADVRLAAVTALQESGSIKAIPFLRQALRDTDNRIVAAASAALSRFKGSKKAAPKAAKKKRRR
ncbi:MAG: HEAT repeat domain-containing protein, partial [Cyanobacteria bacterium J06636_28]